MWDKTKHRTGEIARRKKESVCGSDPIGRGLTPKRNAPLQPPKKGKFGPRKKGQEMACPKRKNLGNEHVGGGYKLKKKEKAGHSPPRGGLETVER